MQDAIDLVTQSCTAVVGWLLQILNIEGVMPVFLFRTFLLMLCVIFPAILAIRVHNDDSREDVRRD